jgi:hypothetical protein
VVNGITPTSPDFRGLADGMFGGLWPMNYFDVTNDERLEVASSVHPGGVCFSFGDGSMRLLRDEITFGSDDVVNNRPNPGSTYKLLLCIDDREVIPAEY